MSKSNGMRFVVILFMVSNLYSLILDLLVVFGKRTPELTQTTIILFFFFALILAGLLVKNRYWILAFVFDGLHTAIQGIASKTYFMSTNSTSHVLPASVMIYMLVGILVMLFSLVFFYKVLLIPDLASRKYAHAWMLVLDDYVKRMLHK